MLVALYEHVWPGFGNRQGRGRWCNSASPTVWAAPAANTKRIDISRGRQVRKGVALPQPAGPGL